MSKSPTSYLAELPGRVWECRGRTTGLCNTTASLGIKGADAAIADLGADWNDISEKPIAWVLSVGIGAVLFAGLVVAVASALATTLFPAHSRDFVQNAAFIGAASIVFGWMLAVVEGVATGVTCTIVSCGVAIAMLALASYQPSLVTNAGTEQSLSYFSGVFRRICGLTDARGVA